MKIIFLTRRVCIFRYTSNGSTLLILLPVTEELFASKSYSVVTGISDLLTSD